MYHTEIKDFTTGSVSSHLFTFAWPLFLSNLLQVVYNMVDMVVVGNVLGKSGISSVSVGGDLIQFLTLIAMGYANAGQVLIAKYVGAKQRDKIGSFVGTMSSFLILCALLLSPSALILQDSILHLMNVPAEAYQGAQDYSTVCMIGLVFIYGYNVVSAILRGMGDSRHPFIFISIAAVLNLLLDLLFVIGLHFGAEGAALATVISQAVSFIACVLFLAKKRQEFELNISVQNFLQWDKEMLGDLIRLGTPMAIKSAAIQTSKLFVNSWINSYGVAVSAFAGIANKISSIANLISNAMNTAGSTMISQNIAANKFDRVKKILKQLSIITLTVAIILSIAICLFSTQIFGLFINENASDVLEIAEGYVPIAVLLFFGSALRAVMNALINGSGNYKINFITAILDGIVMRIGLAVLFGLSFNMKHYGFWLGDALAGFTPFWIGLIFYFTVFLKKAKKA